MFAVLLSPCRSACFGLSCPEVSVCSPPHMHRHLPCTGVGGERAHGPQARLCRHCRPGHPARTRWARMVMGGSGLRSCVCWRLQHTLLQGVADSQVAHPPYTLRCCRRTHLCGRRQLRRSGATLVSRRCDTRRGIRQHSTRCRRQAPAHSFPLRCLTYRLTSVLIQICSCLFAAPCARDRLPVTRCRLQRPCLCNGSDGGRGQAS